MSASKRAYEGPDPQQLLLQVWNNHGTEARISEPERVRKGGVMGFFATSVYRVEVDEEPSVPEVVAAATPPAPPTPPPAPRPLAKAAASDNRSSLSSGLAGLIDEAEDTFELSTLPNRSFDEILEDVAGSLGVEPASFTPPPFAPPTPPVPAAPRAFEPLPIERFDSIDDLVRRAIGKTVEEDTALGLAVPESLLDAAGLTPSSTPVVPIPVAERPVDAVPVTKAPAAEAPAVPVAAPPAASEPEHSMPRSLAELPFFAPPADAQERLTSLLDGIGFPTSMLAPLARTPLFPTCIADAFALLGPSPSVPKAHGALLAVVGAPGEVLAAARAIAGAHHLDPAQVALIAAPKSTTAALPATPAAKRGTRTCVLDPGRPAAGFFATDVATIRALGPGWRRDRVGIVAVELDSKSTRFVRSALRALAPSAVWVGADARMKNEDLLARTEAIGGADALMLDHVSETTTPAAVLQAGIPVATLDGRRADVTRWIRVVRPLTGER